MTINSDVGSVTKEELVELWESVGWGTEEDKMVRTVQAIRNSENVFLAREGGKLLGLVSAISDGWNVYITYLVVNRKRQSTGLGSALLELCKDAYRGCRLMLLSFNASEFYKHHGFTEVMHGMSQGISLPDNVGVTNMMYTSVDGCKFRKLESCVDWNTRLEGCIKDED